MKQKATLTIFSKTKDDNEIIIEPEFYSDQELKYFIGEYIKEFINSEDQYEFKIIKE